MVEAPKRLHHFSEAIARRYTGYGPLCDYLSS
jgi:hypothetical protein